MESNIRSMRRASYNEIMSSLPTLQRKELEEIRRRVTLILQNKSGSKYTSVEETDYLLHGIRICLKERGLEDQIPSNFKIKKMGSFAAYQTKSDVVRRILDKAIPDITAVERLHLGEVCIRSLANFISSWKSSNTVSFESLMIHIDEIPSAIQNSFPGYLESGLLHVILRRDLARAGY